MPSDLEVIERLRSAFGGRDAPTTNQATVATGTATLSSDGGTVVVDLGGDATTGEGTQFVEVPTTVDVREGDSVSVTIVNGSPTVTGVVGGGDRTRGEVEDVQLSVDRAKDSLTVTIAEVAKDVTANAESISDVAKSVQDAATTRETYMRYSNDADGRPQLEMGASDATAKMRLTNEKLSFISGDEEVAYMSGAKLGIANAQVDQSLTLGGFAWVPRSGGDLALKWVGTNVD